MISNHHISNRSYSSKVILLGEYSVIHEGEILAVPLPLHTARWKVEKPTVGRKDGLKMILNYLQTQDNQVIDALKFAKSIEEGLYLQSDIPSGYGLGSSGAITAALYDLFAIVHNEFDTTLLKQDLLDIESCFHGVSSGIDPLVIYLDKCIHIDQNGIHVINEPLDLSHYFLIDTGKARKTSPFVKQYLECAKKDSYLRAVEKYKSIVSNAISLLLASDHSALSNSMAAISQWQYEHLDFAILDEYRDLWRSTLDMEGVSIKLCGAGGGGYLLGYALDIDKALTQFSDYSVRRLS